MNVIRMRHKGVYLASLTLALFFIFSACERQTTTDDDMDVGTSSPTATTPTTTEEVDTVDVMLTEYSIDMPSTVPAGTVVFAVTNLGTEPHNIEITRQDTPGAGAGEMSPDTETDPTSPDADRGQTSPETEPGQAEREGDAEQEGLFGDDDQYTFDQDLEPGETNTLEVDLEPGTYSVHSTMQANRDQGMSAQLEVTESQRGTDDRATDRLGTR